MESPPGSGRPYAGEKLLGLQGLRKVENWLISFSALSWHGGCKELASPPTVFIQAWSGHISAAGWEAFRAVPSGVPVHDIGAPGGAHLDLSGLCPGGGQHLREILFKGEGQTFLEGIFGRRYGPPPLGDECKADRAGNLIEVPISNHRDR